MGFSEAARKDSKFNENLKQNVEDYLVGSTVRMYVYCLQEFNPKIARDKHLEIVRKVTLFEKMVIDLFRSQKKNIANKKMTKRKINYECPYQEILQQIVTDFELNPDKNLKRF